MMNMPRPIAMLAVAGILVLCLAGGALALGTPAGTVITNRAAVQYQMSGSSYTQNTNPVTFRVDDKVMFTLTASDTANVTIFPNGRAAMTCLLTNTGNGPHDFTLAAVVTGIPTLTPAAGPAFYADAAGTVPLPLDGNAGGLPYVSSLASDATRTVYLFITAPAAPADGQTVAYAVTAEAYQENNLGTVNPPVKSSTQAAADAPASKNANPMSRYFILADGHGNGGDSDRDGRYAVVAQDGSGSTIGFIARSATLSITKSQTVADVFGGTRPMTGSTIHYTLTVTVNGSGSAANVVVTDPLPANTTYMPGTLRLNGNLLTDAGGDDGGDVGGTAPGAVTVSIGTMTGGSPQAITFDVKIN